MFTYCFGAFAKIAGNETRSQQNSEGGSKFQSLSDSGLITLCPTTITEQNHFTHELSMFTLDFRNAD